ncbi:MAG: TetR/AcrR family transcriptional regulator [Parvibaculaceae bacterium]|nr:TetR/AcrR family transcriptional regulator [Parvibaculaceae bacterium]
MSNIAHPTPKMKHKPTKGRPALSDAQKENMRAEIADHAERLFQKEGYSAISMRRLAGEVGCSPMTLYKYYENKIDILRQLWGQIFKTLFDQIEGTRAANATASQTLAHIAKTYVAYWLSHTEHYRLVFMSEGISQPEVGVFVGDTQIENHLIVFFEAMQQATQLDPQDIRLKHKTDLLICTLNGIAHSHITISAYPWTEAEKLVEMTVTNLLNA